MKTRTFLTLATLLTCSLGCDTPEMNVPVQQGSTQEGSVTTAEEKKSEESTLFGKEDWYLPDGRVDMSDVAGEPPMTTSVPREVTAKDPKKGKLTRKKGGALGTSLKALPWAEFETKFQMIKYNMAQYDAIKGHYPKSHKEFMEEYLPEFYPAALPLPELEPGDEYIYDPEDHTLKIYRPEG